MLSELRRLLREKGQSPARAEQSGQLPACEAALPCLTLQIQSHTEVAGWVGAAVPWKLLSSLPVSWLGVLESYCMFTCVELLAFRIARGGGGESEIWLRKVIWPFISRTALLPTACFKLNLWHQGIHHFNCMFLFSQAQICFVLFFPLSCVV